jgi:predicted ATPase
MIIEKYRKWLKETLKEKLETSFGMSVQNLISLGSSSAEIKIPSLRVLISANGQMEVKWLREQEIVTQIKSEISNQVDRICKARRRDDRLNSAFTMIHNVDQKMRKLMLEEEMSKGKAIYIPAGRAGLLESFHTVHSALLSLSPLAFTRDIKVPGLPSIAAKFYITLNSLGRKKGPMFKIAKDFKDILGGDILLRRKEEERAPFPLSMEYTFRYYGKESSVDIIHAASMIKELAPLYLITREIIKPNDFLIIEEPESHLHPGAQLKLVEILAKLINKNVYVLATTHSDLLLRKVALLVGQRLVKKDDPTSLDARKVAIYLLKDTERGCVSQEITIPEDGILEELPTFDDVIRELYEKESMQSAQLERQ